MIIYRRQNRKTNWGDYGDILVSGMTAHLDRHNDLLQLERTGPYVPPLVNSGLWDIVVTDKVKESLMMSQLTGINFKPVIKKHIVELDWTTWDTNAEEPTYYPQGGEPEDYILEREHSESLSKRMGDLWELVIPTIGTFSNENFIFSGQVFDIFKADNRGYILVTEKGKDWIERNAGDWVTFEMV
jgi:hypothetical protein